MRQQYQQRALPGCLPHFVAHRAWLNQHITPGVVLVQDLQSADGSELAPDIGADTHDDHILKQCRGHPALIQDDCHDAVMVRDGKRMPGTQRVLQPTGIACLRGKEGKDERQNEKPFPAVHDGLNAAIWSRLTCRTFHPGGLVCTQKYVVQKQDTGMAITREGSMLATGKTLIPAMRRPVATIKIPPTAEKSACMTGVVSGKI